MLVCTPPHTTLTTILWVGFLMLFLPPDRAMSRQASERFREFGDFYLPAFSSSMFPSPKRDTAHWYGGKRYSAKDHYRDSSVALFVPKGFKAGKVTDVVVYIHGWFNNVDTALSQYRIIEQFALSRRNAVLIHPEGPRNAPDSYGGKLEDPGLFKRLVGDAMEFLLREKRITSRSIGSIVLAGHSGAYRVMSYILLHGGLTDHIKEVYLFDALYGQTEKYAHWIDHSKGRLINIFTVDGGTKQESLNLMDCLTAWKISYYTAPETTLTTGALRRHRLLFIASDLRHNDVIMERNQFRQYLETGSLLPVGGRDSRSIKHRANR